MSIPEVGQGKVSIWPTFKGFRQATNAEVDGSTREASSRFTKGFSSAGSSAGKGFASGFKSSTKDLSSDALRKATEDVARASRDVSAARVRELDLTGKVRIAQSALADAQRRYASDSTQVIRAEERLAAAHRAAATAATSSERSTERLAAAQRDLASATSGAVASSGRFSSAFRGAGNTSGQEFFSGFMATALSVFGGALGANLVTGIGYTIGRGISRAVSSAIDFSFEGIGFASALEQSEGAVASVFKDGASLIVGYSEDAANAVGISQAAYQKYATIVGAQLKNLGLRVDDVAPKTNELIELGADLAAQFGGPTSDAVAAISSLLRGERDPIERYGVGLKQVDINARLAAWGMSDLTGEAEKQATIQATLALLWEQTADAQGTFNRESDTFAHKQQVALALLEQAQTRFGGLLLPVATEGLSFATDTLLPRFESILERVGPKLAAAFSDVEVEQLIGTIGDLADQTANWAESGGIQLVVDGINADLQLLGDFGKIFSFDFSPIYRDNKALFDGFVGWLGEVGDSNFLGAQANKIGVTLAKGIGTGIEAQRAENVAIAGGSAEDMINAFVDPVGVEKLTHWARDLDSSWGMALKEGKSAEAAKQLGTDNVLSFRRGILEGTPFMFSSAAIVGNQYIDGLVQGVRDKKSTAINEAADVAAKMLSSAKKTLGIKSPSTEGMAIGDYFMQGIGLGITGRRSSLDSIVRESMPSTARLATAAMTGLASSSANSGDPRGSGLPAVYVQNPFTGEYLLAQVATVADGQIRVFDAQAASDIRGRSVR